MAGAGGLTVLVVEDDPDVRAVIGVMLEAPGVRVLTAGNATEALDLARVTAIDLLLTDVVLPGLSGRRVAEQLRALHPDLPVLFISGWYDHPEFPGLEGEQVLQKPFSREDLTWAIAAALRGDDRSPSSSDEP